MATTATSFRLAGGVLLASLALHIVVNVPAGELLWTCYIATVILGVSLLARWPVGIGVGFIFHAGVGLPAYVLDLLAGAITGTGAPLSIAVHFLAPIIGAWASLRIRYLVPRAWLAAWALYLVMTLLSVYCTDPALNVNVAHQAWPPIARYFPSIWLYRAGNMTFAFCTLFAADRVFRWLLRRISLRH